MATAIEKPKQTRVEYMREVCQTRMAPYVQQLVSRSPPTRFIRAFLNVLEQKPELLLCTPQSICRALLHCAELDLEPGGANPKVYLIPYNNRQTDGSYKAELSTMVGVWGYRELLMRAGCLKVWGDVVYEKDEYKFTSGSAGKQIEHYPKWGEADRGKVVLAYGCVKLASGEVIMEPMSAAELELARSKNRSRGTVWEDWGDPMRIKSAIKRTAKYCPQGWQLDRALAIDRYAELGGAPVPVLTAEGEAIDVDVPEPSPPSPGGAEPAPARLDPEP
jgi:phage RecT family recombinase